MSKIKFYKIIHPSSCLSSFVVGSFCLSSFVVGSFWSFVVGPYFVLSFQRLMIKMTIAKTDVIIDMQLVDWVNKVFSWTHPLTPFSIPVTPTRIPETP